MQGQQTIAIELPQKLLVWEDTEAKVWVSYNDPHYLSKRHDIVDCDKLVGKIDTALGNIVAAACR